MEYIEMDGSKYISYQWMVITEQDETYPGDNDVDGFKGAFFDCEGPEDCQDNGRRVKEKKKNQKDDERKGGSRRKMRGMRKGRCRRILRGVLKRRDSMHRNDWKLLMESIKSYRYRLLPAILAKANIY